ncbi:hypothetical protein EJ04DRAFT_81012 [Polyplosphaeria fusca]|uniref:Uncharacterized protein n=1 Tax=Polyplosphaeria fusca TaxID=682080 RepID=A0A9P4R739_9PLEO|nr:hypothetical protein EJ04DRAFT_81012 [Polyplosphaeria fusca]
MHPRIAPTHIRRARAWPRRRVAPSVGLHARWTSFFRHGTDGTDGTDGSILSCFLFRSPRPANPSVRRSTTLVVKPNDSRLSPRHAAPVPDPSRSSSTWNPEAGSHPDRTGCWTRAAQHPDQWSCRHLHLFPSISTVFTPRARPSLPAHPM